MARSTRLSLILPFALCLGLSAGRLSSTAATPATLNLGHWADAQMTKAMNVPEKPVSSVVIDHFGAPYAPITSGGLKVLSAGSGSMWVYDSKHHIVAVTERGDVNGSFVFYLTDPLTTKLPERDLSHVTSAHGLRLGVSPTQAAEVLRVPSSAIVRSADGKAILYTRKQYRCRSFTCVHETVLKFVDSKAVAVSIYDLGP